MDNASQRQSDQDNWLQIGQQSVWLRLVFVTPNLPLLFFLRHLQTKGSLPTLFLCW